MSSIVSRWLPHASVTPVHHRGGRFGALASLVLIALALYLGGSAAARSETGRAMIARQIERALNDGIEGHVTIERLERIDRSGLIATNLAFFDSSGRRVLDARTVELAVDWSAWLSGRVVSSSGIVRGARLWIESSPSGDLRIARAFAPSTSPGRGEPIGRNVVLLEHLQVEDAEVVATVDGSPPVRATDLSMVVASVYVPEHGAARARAVNIEGSLRVDTPSPTTLAIAGGIFTLDGATRRARMTYNTTVGGEARRVSLDLRAPRRERLRVVRIEGPGGPVEDHHSSIARALDVEVAASTLPLDFAWL